MLNSIYDFWVTYYRTCFYCIKSLSVVSLIGHLATQFTMCIRIEWIIKIKKFAIFFICYRGFIPAVIMFMRGVPVIGNMCNVPGIRLVRHCFLFAVA